MTCFENYVSDLVIEKVKSRPTPLANLFNKYSVIVVPTNTEYVVTVAIYIH